LNGAGVGLVKEKIRVCLSGVTGWVGRGLAPAILEAPDLELSAAVSRSQAGRKVAEALEGIDSEVRIRASVAEALETPCDVLVDYTSSHAALDNVLAAVDRGVHVVVGTSGLDDADYARIDRAARERSVGVLAAGNFALTAVLLQRLAETAARHLPQWEILEYARAQKPDAPSGTARELAARLGRVRASDAAPAAADSKSLREARGATLHGAQVHSVRLPGFVSSIEILFGLPEERLSIRHDSGSGSGPYVAGTLLAIRKVGGVVGLRRGLDTVMEL
jgi:4-hydroxy-tetrahydrodipicolinate reductase